MMPGHIWREGGRGPCVVCEVKPGTPGPCASRMARYPSRAVLHRADRERGAPVAVDYNEGAGRPDWWG